MNPEHPTKQHLMDVVTQRLSTPELAKDQVTGTPVLVGMTLLLCAVLPPHSPAKLYVILGVEALSVIWASWLYILWKRRTPADPDNPAQKQVWIQFSTLIYHLARVMLFLLFSLGMLTVSLLIFSNLQIRAIQLLLLISYGVSSIVLFANRYRLLEISITGVQSETWKRFSACVMVFGAGAAGIGSALGMLISRLAPRDVGLGIVGFLSSVTLAIPALAYFILEVLAAKAFFDKGVWHRKKNT